MTIKNPAPHDFEALVDKYLLNQMTIEEKNDFENQLDKDSNLFLFAKEQKRLIHLIRFRENEKLKELIKANPSSGRSFFHRYRFQFAAAMVAFFVIALMLRLLLDNNTSLQTTVIADYTQMAPVPENYIAFDMRGVDSKSLFSIGMKFYEKGNYSEAMEFFNKLDNWSEIHPNGVFYYGLTAFLLKDFQTSLRVFESIKSDDFFFNEYLPIYFAIIHIETNNIQAAKDTLEKVVKSNSQFSGTAGNILNQLPSNQ